MSKLHDEPSLETIDDFDGKESTEKRNTVRLVIALILIVGAIFSYFKYENSQTNDYVGTTDNPGMNTTKGAY